MLKPTLQFFPVPVSMCGKAQKKSNEKEFHNHGLRFDFVIT